MNGTPETPTPIPQPDTNGKPTLSESNILGVSVRAWVTLVIVVTGCGMSAVGKEITDPLYSLLLIVVSFYFGQKVAAKT